VEYLFHRYVLHGPLSSGSRLDSPLFFMSGLNPLHWEHHERPFLTAGTSAVRLKDILPALCGGRGPSAFFFPVYTLPALLAGVVQSYVGEEWLHYFLHFRKVSDSPLPASQAIPSVSSQPPAEWKKGYGNHQRSFGDVVFHTRLSKASSRNCSLKKSRGARPGKDDALRGFKTSSTRDSRNHDLQRRPCC